MMRKAILIISIFLLVILVVFVALKSFKGRNRFEKLKNNRIVTHDTLVLGETKFVSKDVIRVFTLKDSIAVVTSRDCFKLDTNLRTISNLHINGAENNSIWTVFQVMDTIYYLLYPSGTVIKQYGNNQESIKLPEVYENCTFLDNMIIGFYRRDSFAFLQYYDLRIKKVVKSTEVSSLFKKVKNFKKNECFPETVIGNFARIGQNKGLYYCYFNSYFIEFNSKGDATLHLGIDSIELPEVKMITTEVSKDMMISKCSLEDERYLVLYGYASNDLFYSLSNVKIKNKGISLLDAYDGVSMGYKYSIEIPGNENNSIVDYFSVDAYGKTFYIFYSDGYLRKFHLSKKIR